MTQFTPPKESSTRKIVDELLINLGWVTDERAPDCQVFTERAKTTEQKKLLGGAFPDYLLYEYGTDRPIAVIEAKRLGETLDEAIRKSIGAYAKPLDIDIVFATDGSSYVTFDSRSDGPLLFNREPVVDLLKPELLLRFANDGPYLETPTPIQQNKQELITIFSKADDLLRQDGQHKGPLRFAVFSNLLFLKLIGEIEDHREKCGQPRRLEARHCWQAFATKSGEEMKEYIEDTVLPRLREKYKSSSDIIQSGLGINAPLVLEAIVSELSKVSLLDVDSDVKGDAFEYFLKHSISVGNDLGEYFTPRHIVKLMVELVDPKYGETVYDPCCGTGGFLIEAFRHISRKVRNSPETRHVLENETIYGREHTDTARIAKMNMILAGDGHTNIYQMDSLKDPVKDKYDVVLTNFPFSQNTEYSSYYGFSTSDANPVFLKHVIDACVDGGRIGVVVPASLLFEEKRAYVSVRKFLAEHCTIDAVISLHNSVFKPYTGQPTAILILKKGVPKSDVWFYQVMEDGFKKTGSKKGRPAVVGGKNDLAELRSIWGEKPQSERSILVQLDQIRQNCYKLLFNTYKSREARENWRPLGGNTGVCKIVIGSTPAKKVGKYWTGGEYPWVTISDMSTRFVSHTKAMITESAVKETHIKRIPKGTVLMSFKLTIGKTAIAGKDLYMNEAIAGLTPKDNRILPEYLYHIIPALDLSTYQQPAAKGYTVNKKIIEKICIPVPPLREQRRFISKMNGLEKKMNDLQKRAQDMREEISNAGEEFLAKS